MSRCGFDSFELARRDGRASLLKRHVAYSCAFQGVWIAYAAGGHGIARSYEADTAGQRSSSVASLPAGALIFRASREGLSDGLTA